MLQYLGPSAYNFYRSGKKKRVKSENSGKHDCTIDFAIGKTLVKMFNLGWIYVQRLHCEALWSALIVIGRALFTIVKTQLLLFNCCVFQSKLTGVCGVVGSGKTSLITAILGEMHTLEGACCVSGCFAYVPQEAWIFSGSVRENVLFGQEMDAERYDRVLEACCLKPDLEILKSGDQTEVPVAQFNKKNKENVVFGCNANKLL